jgi:hypothetical protein
MKYVSISEILNQVSLAKTKEEKIQLLKAHNSLALRDILRASFDDSIVFLLPEGNPPFKSYVSMEGITPTDLKRSTTQFTYFVKGGKGSALSQAKREKMFIALLEGINPGDAEVVCAMKEKKLQEKFPGISKDLIKEVWPKLIRV